MTEYLIAEIEELKENLECERKYNKNMYELLIGFLDKNNLRDEYSKYVLSGKKSKKIYVRSDKH